jgi:hypothetical protein
LRESVTTTRKNGVRILPMRIKRIFVAKKVVLL